MKSILKLTWLMAFALFVSCGGEQKEAELSEVEKAKKEMEEAAKKGSSPRSATLPPHEKKEGGEKKEESTPTPAPAAAQAETTAPGGGEWVEWGRNGSNNMMSPAKGIPSDFTGGQEGSDGKIEGAKHARWVVEMGSQAYGTATVKDGKIFIGTNNEKPRLENIVGDHGIVMCFDEKSGEFLWQLSIPKLGAGKVSDWEFLGVCSSVAIDGKYGYVITNRGEVLCIDTYGMSDGNDGPFQDEGKYMAAGFEGIEKAKSGEIPEITPLEVGKNDADIVWGYDMRSNLGVFPHNITSSSVKVTDKHIFASTSNGVDWSHINVPFPENPCLVALDKKTGELAAEEISGIGENVMHCNWSSPAYSVIGDNPTVVFGAGDGFTYGFHATEFIEEEDGDEKYYLLKELWKVDCCPEEYRFDSAGEPIKYATYPGPSEIISSPVVYNNKVYACIGQDPEHGEGVGAVTCIDPSKGNGEDAIVWQFKEIGRTISTPSIVDGLVYIADYSGKLFCLDAETGEKYWVYDSLSHIWGSTLVVDGKVFLGNEDGEMIIIAASKDADKDGDGEIRKEKKNKDGTIKQEGELINIVEYPASIYSTPVVANGTLYVMTQTHLYAYEGKQ